MTFLRFGDRDPNDYAGASVATMLFGFIVVVAGVLILAWPGISVVTLAVIFALQLLVVGVFRVVSSMTSQDVSGGGRALMAVLGVLSILFGILFLRHPFETIGALVLGVGLFWVISGALETVHAVGTHDMSGRGWAIAGGIVGMIAGIVMLSIPAIGVLVLVWLLGLELVIYGGATIGRGVQAWRLEHGPIPTAAPPVGHAPA